MAKERKPKKLEKTLSTLGKSAIAGGTGAIASGQYLSGLLSVGVGLVLWIVWEYRDEMRRYLESLSEGE